MEGIVEPIPMAKIAIKPRKAKLGTIKINTEKTVPLNITNTGNAPLTITRIYSKRSNTTHFDAEKKGEIKIGAGKSKKIEINIKPQKTGRFLDVIQFDCNARNAGQKGVYKILATAKVE